MLTATDIDGNVYKTVHLGDLYWTTSNLKTTRFNDGTPIKKISSQDQVDSFRNQWGGVDLPESFCCYDFREAYAEKFGCLYTLSAVTKSKEGPQNYHDWPGFNFINSLLAPDGWQIPTLDDWGKLHKMLNDSCGNNSGKVLSGCPEANVQQVMKSIDSWDRDLNGSNSVGLDILASGYLSNEGKFMDLGKCAEIWLATVTGPDFDHNNLISLGCNSSNIVPKMASVRLVRKAK